MYIRWAIFIGCEEIKYFNTYFTCDTWNVFPLFWFCGQTLGAKKSKLKYHCQASSLNPATGDGEGFDWQSFLWWLLPRSLWWGSKAKKLNLSPIFLGFINISYPWSNCCLDDGSSDLSKRTWKKNFLVKTIRQDF